MKKLVLILLLSTQIFAQSFYTLDHIRSLNLYLDIQTDFIDKAQKKALKESLTKKLEKAGFIFGETDALVFVIHVKSLEIEDSLAIYIDIGIGEDVVAKRTKEIETFAYTYRDSKFIEGYSPYEDTIEALNSLIDVFIDAHKDDNEE